jgi:hypothetical protein
MRPLALALAAATLVAGPVLAQPVPPAKATPPAAAVPKGKYTLDTPIHQLMEDPRMLAWLDKHFPGLSERMSDPEVGTLFAGVSIQGLAIDPDHGRALTPAVMAKLAVSLEKAQGEAPPPS